MVSEEMGKWLILGKVYIPRNLVTNRGLRKLAWKNQYASKAPRPSFNYGCEKPGEKKMRKEKLGNRYQDQVEAL